MYVSPYINEAIENPVPKTYFTPQDIILDTKLTHRDKSLLLKQIIGVEEGLIHFNFKINRHLVID